MFMGPNDVRLLEMSEIAEIFYDTFRNDITSVTTKVPYSIRKVNTTKSKEIRNLHFPTSTTTVSALLRQVARNPLWTTEYARFNTGIGTLRGIRAHAFLHHFLLVSKH